MYLLTVKRTCAFRPPVFTLCALGSALSPPAACDCSCCRCSSPRRAAAAAMPSVDDGSKLIAELSSHSSKMAALLPQVQASVHARLQAVEAREKAVSSREKELAAQEKSLAERERKLAAAIKESERKKEAAAKQKEKAATGPRKLPAAPAAPAPPSIIDIPMDALARATAAALLRVSG